MKYKINNISFSGSFGDFQQSFFNYRPVLEISIFIPDEWCLSSCGWNVVVLL